MASIKYDPLEIYEEVAKVLLHLEYTTRYERQQLPRVIETFISTAVAIYEKNLRDSREKDAKEDRAYVRKNCIPWLISILKDLNEGEE